VAQLCAAKRGFYQWLYSKAPAAMMDGWNETLLATVAQPADFEACSRSLFPNYELPADSRGWLLSHAVLAESLPICVTISDAQIAGFPLVYVNSKFTDVTGYTKRDCAGRNCRFLQGPATVPEHGQHLLDTLRRGANSQTLMVNYRKTGEVFENLLTMRYVNDSQGRRRFCVGFQLDLTGMESDPGPWGSEALGSEEGKELMIQSQKKMVQLIKMLPEAIEVPPTSNQPPAAAADVPPPTWRCPQLDRLALVVGRPAGEQSGVTWLEALCQCLDDAADSAIVVDMTVACLPIVHANRQFCEMTGYAKEEAVGRNCRFLQCKGSEPLAISRMIASIREHRPLELTITNARKDGSEFPHNLSLHFITTSTGLCRFCVGISKDGHTHPPGGPLEHLRKAIPTSFDVQLQPRPPQKFTPVDPIAQWKHFQPTMTKLVRMLWAVDPHGACRKLMSLPGPIGAQAVESVRGFLAKKAPGDAALFETLLQARAQGSWHPLQGASVSPARQEHA